LFCRAAGRIETLGTFWLDDVRLAELADRLRSRVTSGGSVAQATAGDSAARLQIKGLPPPPQVARAPEESPDAWYRKWWFWTAVGVVALGAAATTTWILLPDSGVRIQAVR
jgi:hypothetical protein